MCALNWTGPEKSLFASRGGRMFPRHEELLYRAVGSQVTSRLASSCEAALGQVEIWDIRR